MCRRTCQSTSTAFAATTWRPLFSSWGPLVLWWLWWRTSWVANDGSSPSRASVVRVGARFAAVFQGCPLSPMLAGVVMALWSQFVEGHEAQLVQTVSVVDDRLVWAASPATLASAMRRSSDFDSACGFRCDPTKCRFAHPSLSDAVRDLAAALGYEEMDRLSILGLVIPLDRLETPSLRDFDLLKARRRLRLIAVAAHGLHQKRRLMGILVVPMLCWAGGYASVAENTLEALLADFRWLWHKDLAADTPPVLCYEIADWEVHPGFARDLAALRCAVGLLCRTPVWLDGASLRLVGRKWPTLLPCTVTVLEDLGWWCDLRGAFVHRRDSYGQVRSFEVGVDNFDILTEWLRDVYRRRGLRRCGRVATSLHRSEEEGLAQGLTVLRPFRGIAGLGAPPTLRVNVAVPWSLAARHGTSTRRWSSAPTPLRTVCVVVGSLPRRTCCATAAAGLTWWSRFVLHGTGWRCGLWHMRCPRSLVLQCAFTTTTWSPAWRRSWTVDWLVVALFSLPPMAAWWIWWRLGLLP